MTDRELRDYIPFMAIVDGCVLSKRGDLTFGWKLKLPTAFSVSENEYDSIINSFKQAYKLLPDWTIVHKQDIFFYDTYKSKPDPFFLADAYSRHFNGRRYLNCYSYIYVTFSSKSVIERKDSESGYFGILDMKAPSRERIENCAAIASQFEAVLGNNPVIGMQALRSEDFLRTDANGRDEGVLADYLRMYDHDGPDYNLSFYPDRVEYGDKMLKVWYVEDSDAYPESVSSVKKVESMSSGYSKVFLSGGSPIGHNLRIPHVVNRYVLRLPKSTVEKELDQRKRLMTSFSLYSSEDKVNAVELEDYLDDSANNSATTTKCFMSLLAWPTREEMAEVRNAVVTAFRSELDVSVVEETLGAPLYHYAAIPSAAPELGYNSYVNSELTAFLCMGLWEGYDFGMKGGLIHVCDRTSRIPITIDIQQKAKELGLISNMNAIVVGPSGTGKSFTMNSLVQDFYASGQHIMIIDVGDSYEGLCGIVNEVSGGKDGVYNTYDPEHPFTFNPFHGREHWNDVDKDGDRLSSGDEFVLSLLTTMYSPKGGWDDTSRSVLDFLLETFFDWWDNGVPSWVVPSLMDDYRNERRRRAEKNGKLWDEARALDGWKDPVKAVFRDDRKGKDPVFDDLYVFVTAIASPLVRNESLAMGHTVVSSKMLDLDDFGAAMRIYSRDGKYGFLLNAEEEADLFESRLTVFEVDQIKDNKQLFPMWVLCIMHSFEDKMRGLPTQKVMVIEEAWSAISVPTMAKYLEWMWRTARKFSTTAVVVTQDIMDLTSSDVVKDTIVLNSSVRILLDQRQNAANFAKAADVLALSPMAKNLVMSVGTNIAPGEHYKEVFISIGPKYCNVFAMEVSSEQAVTFESEKPKKAPFIALAKKCGSFVQACIQIVAEKLSLKKAA